MDSEICNLLCERAIKVGTAAGNWKQIWNLEEFELEMKLLVSSTQRCYDKPRKRMKPLEGEKKQIENRSLGNI